MLIFTPPKTEPEWIEVLGVRFLMKPITRSLVTRARAAVRALRNDHPDASEELVSEAYSTALMLEGAVNWEGVYELREDGDQDVPLPFSRDGMALVIEDSSLFDALEAAYVVPFIARHMEKNGSSPSLSGTGAGATLARTIAG